MCVSANVAWHRTESTIDGTAGRRTHPVGGFPWAGCPPGDPCRATGRTADVRTYLPQVLDSAGLGITGLVSVPPKRATSGVPYSAAFPKSFVVTPAMSAPKFHTHCAWALPLLVRVQYG